MDQNFRVLLSYIAYSSPTRVTRDSPRKRKKIQEQTNNNNEALSLDPNLRSRLVLSSDTVDNIVLFTLAFHFTTEAMETHERCFSSRSVQCPSHDHVAS